METLAGALLLVAGLLMLGEAIRTSFSSVLVVGALAFLVAGVVVGYFLPD